MSKMALVLDLDLDFFVWPIEYNSENGRLDGRKHKCASVEQVEVFLESQCGLSKSNPLPGHLCIDHVDAFHTWRAWIESGIISAPFEVVHADAHADLGQGDHGSWKYLLTEIMALPIEQRTSPVMSPKGLHSGSYLAFAIACGWISSATYVYPTGRWQVGNARFPIDAPPSRDLPAIYFRDRTTPNEMVMGHYDEMTANSLGFRSRIIPIADDIRVPFHSVGESSFLRSGFTHIVLAHSKTYTPTSADRLLLIIKQYFYEC